MTPCSLPVKLSPASGCRRFVICCLQMLTGLNHCALTSIYSTLLCWFRASLISTLFRRFCCVNCCCSGCCALLSMA